MPDEQKPSKAEEPTYHRDRLVNEAQGFFGEPGYVIEAALSTGRLGQKQNFTLDEVKQAIKDYNDHEVEIEHVGTAGEEG